MAAARRTRALLQAEVIQRLLITRAEPGARDLGSVSCSDKRSSPVFRYRFELYSFRKGSGP